MPNFCLNFLVLISFRSKHCAICKSENPYFFASRIKFSEISDTSTSCNLSYKSKIFLILIKNHESIVDSLFILDIGIPNLIALTTSNKISSLGYNNFCSINSSSSFTSSSLPTKPIFPASVILIAFCNTSSNVLPIAITSPTDFILVPILLFTNSNFLKSHLGIFRTT